MCNRIILDFCLIPWSIQTRDTCLSKFVILYKFIRWKLIIKTVMFEYSVRKAHALHNTLIIIYFFIKI